MGFASEQIVFCLTFPSLSLLPLPFSISIYALSLSFTPHSSQLTFSAIAPLQKYCVAFFSLIPLLNLPLPFSTSAVCVFFRLPFVTSLLKVNVLTFSSLAPFFEFQPCSLFFPYVPPQLSLLGFSQLWFLHFLFSYFSSPLWHVCFLFSSLTFLQTAHFTSLLALLFSVITSSLFLRLLLFSVCTSSLSLLFLTSSLSLLLRPFSTVILASSLLSLLFSI